MRDGALLRVLKAVVRTLVRFDLGVHRLLLRARGRAPLLLAGECALCAACCEAPEIRVGPITWYLPTARRAFLLWQRRVNGFELASADFQRRTFTFRCTHFDRATRRCDSYASRPAMCRDYPRLLLEQPHPELMPSCGYRPLARDAKRRLRLLDAQPLTDAQRARLVRDMFLE